MLTAKNSSECGYCQLKKRLPGKDRKNSKEQIEMKRYYPFKEISVVRPEVVRTTSIQQFHNKVFFKYYFGK